MAERRDTLCITVKAREDVQIDVDLVLPPGTYPGTGTRVGVALGGQTSWTAPRYMIQLSGWQLIRMGVPNTDLLLTVNVDVTPLINAGKLRVL